jgi:hypothetical protein
MSKRGSLSDFAAKKPAADLPAPVPGDKPDDVAPREKAKRISIAIRLNPQAWRQLHQLTLELGEQRDTRLHQHDLLIEALNDLFTKYRKPPIA